MRRRINEGRRGGSSATRTMVETVRDQMKILNEVVGRLSNSNDRVAGTVGALVRAVSAFEAEVEEQGRDIKKLGAGVATFGGVLEAFALSVDEIAASQKDLNTRLAVVEKKVSKK